MGPEKDRARRGWPQEDCGSPNDPHREMGRTRGGLAETGILARKMKYEKKTPEPDPDRVFFIYWRAWEDLNPRPTD